MNQRRPKKQTQTAGSVQEGQDLENYETNQDVIVHIQIIIGLVDGRRLELDCINDLIRKMRQHSMAFDAKSNYQCTRAP